MTFTPFSTPEAALAACEAAGLQPLVGSDHQFGTTYGVCPPGFSTYIHRYGDRDFLAWCNGYFRMVALRQAAGWEYPKPYGWRSPDGTSEDEWASNNWPLPEVAWFADWFCDHPDAALDAGVGPNAPAPSPGTSMRP